jgi:hypothetical protein
MGAGCQQPAASNQRVEIKNTVNLPARRSGGCDSSVISVFKFLSTTEPLCLSFFLTTEHTKVAQSAQRHNSRTNNQPVGIKNSVNLPARWSGGCDSSVNSVFKFLSTTENTKIAQRTQRHKSKTRNTKNEMKIQFSIYQRLSPTARRGYREGPVIQWAQAESGPACRPLRFFLINN